MTSRRPIHAKHIRPASLLRRFALLVGFLSLWQFVNGRTANAADPFIDSAMYADPKLELPDVIRSFPDGLPALWQKALARSETELQIESAKAIARAHRIGMPGLRKRFEPALRKILNAETTHVLARRAVAGCLVVIGARDAAGDLFKHLKADGVAYAQIVEPALAKWKHEPAKAIWLARLDAKRVRPGLLRLAIDALATVNESDAKEPLWRIASDTTRRSDMRLLAARTLARVQTSGLVERAKTLSADRSPRGMVNRLVAATILSRHSDDAALDALLTMTTDRQPAIVAIALDRLLETSPQRIVPSAPSLLKNNDPKVRLLTAKAVSARISVAGVRLLGPYLDDRHPAVRRYLRDRFIEFATQQNLRTTVLLETTRVLAADSWRGQEQAAMVLGALKHKPAAKRLVTLLESKRPEVMTASAWALRKLAVPATLPAMLNRATRMTNARKRNDDQLIQLFQAFGEMNYAAATPLMWRFIPKDSFLPETRSAAIWSLGFVTPKARRANLVRLLTARLADVESSPAENDVVRRFCAISMGRVGTKSTAAPMRKFYKSDTPNSNVGLACRWGIHQLTGEWLPGAKPARKLVGGWSLQPIKPPMP